MSEIQVNGTQLAYTEKGQGEPLLFIHGSLGDFRSWEFQMEPFAKQYQPIAYSRRYHYPNSWSGDGSDYSAHLHTDDLAAFITGLDLGRTHIVADSYGACISLLLAVRHPELVWSLVLGEPPLLPWLDQLQGGPTLFATFMANVWEPARQAFQKGELEQGVRTFIDGIMGEGTFDELPPPVRQSLMDNAPEMKLETAAPHYFPALTCEDLRQVTAPTLLLSGEHSPKMFHLITDELERCLPHNERGMIPNTPHGVHTGNPQAYNETVLAFLRRHS